MKKRASLITLWGKTAVEAMKNTWLSRAVTRCMLKSSVFLPAQGLRELLSGCTELKVITQCSDLRLLCGAQMALSAQALQEPAGIVLGIETGSVLR